VPGRHRVAIDAGVNQDAGGCSDMANHNVLVRSLVVLLAMVPPLLLPQPSVTAVAAAAVITLGSEGADGPAITHVPVLRLKPDEDLVVEATVVGPRPIARVSLSFQAGDRFGEAPLERSGPSSWRAKIPASRFGRSFTYIIHASDEGGRVATWPDAAAAHLVLVIADDRRPAPAARDEQHLLYVAVPGVRNYVEHGGVGLLVYDITDGHRFVKRIPTVDVRSGDAPENVKGIAVSAETGFLYVTTQKRLIAIDTKTERIVWNREYEGGCDRLARQTADSCTCRRSRDLTGM